MSIVFYSTFSQVKWWELCFLNIFLSEMVSIVFYSSFCKYEMVSIGFYSTFCHYGMVSIVFYSPFYIFYRDFTLNFSTMLILWDRNSQYHVLLIIHAQKSHSSSSTTRDFLEHSWWVKHDTGNSSSQYFYIILKVKIEYTSKRWWNGSHFFIDHVNNF